MVHEIVGIAAGELRRAILLHEAGQLETRSEIQQHRLEAPHVAVGLDDRMADRVARRVRLGDRPVEDRDAVPPLEIGRVGQDEIGVGHHLGVVGIRVDDARDLVLAGLGIFVRQILERIADVHRRVPAHVRHVHEQGVDGVRIAERRVRDDHVHEAMGGERRIPAIGLVDALRCVGGVDQQVGGARREAEMRAGKRLAGFDLAGLAGRLQARCDLFRIGRLVSEAARAVDRAEQDLQDVNEPAGLEAVRVGRDAAHGVHGDGTADHFLVTAPVDVRPGNIERDGLLEGDLRHLVGVAADRGGRHAALFLRALG